jgi:hypothetical protein
MSLVAMVAVFQRSRAELGARLVLLALAEFAHDDGTHAFPSTATLAARTRLSERQVFRALRTLEDLDEIRRTGRTAKGVVVWSITLPTPDNLSGGADISGDGESGDNLSGDPSNRQIRKSDDVIEPEERARRWLSVHPEVTNPETLHYVLGEFGLEPSDVQRLLNDKEAKAA